MVIARYAILALQYKVNKLKYQIVNERRRHVYMAIVLRRGVFYLWMKTEIIQFSSANSVNIFLHRLKLNKLASLAGCYTYIHCGIWTIYLHIYDV